ncbi:LysR family transcriptional regulator [Kiloniella antarctica]|uniref:LysR family transcriptional regulator n=1 Tax=Kiloniella antarctica TaxID=1550907 RepID=A0ABW5BI43_9PROT
MINPFLIQTFLTLCETRHFTRTAEKLHMTQPGVSQHLKKLEAEMGVALFYRHGKRIELTPAGEIFKSFSLKQHKQEATLRENLGKDSLHHGECKIACSGSMAMQLYPPLLILQKKHPGLGISIEAAPNNTIINLIKTNTFDLGLITNVIEDPEITIHKLGHEELCLIVPHDRGHSWAKLLALGYVNHPNGTHYANQVLEKNYPNNFKNIQEIRQTSYINQINQILLPVSLGLGFTVLPESTVNLFPNQNAIRKAPLAKPTRETVYVITKKHKPLPNRYQLVRELLERNFHKTSIE